MARRVVLHIGLMKSGTTFLQGRLNANREVLAGQGILFPGPTWARHSRAVSDLIGSKRRVPGSWAGLREEIRAHEGDAIVSMEYLAPIGAGLIDAVAADFPGSELHMVATVRDLGRTVPAMWQEALKNRQTWTWEEYLRSLETGGDAGRRFWRQQDAGKIVTRWTNRLGPEHVTVVTVPPPGAPPEQLWDRFRDVAGIADAAWAEAPRANESLGAASALVMGQLNLATTDLPLEAYKKRVKALGKHVLSGRRGVEQPIGFTVPPWLQQRAAKIRRQLETSGARVVGSYDELTPLDVPGVDPRAVDAAAERDAAVAALAGVLHQVRRIT